MSNLLTQRELQIVELLSQGLSAKDISNDLHISIETVHSHKKNMMIKSNCRNSVMLVANCIKQGLI